VAQKYEFSGTTYGYALFPNQARKRAVGELKKCWDKWRTEIDKNEDAIPECKDVDGLGRTFYQTREKLREKAPSCTAFEYGIWTRHGSSGGYCDNNNYEGYIKASMNSTGG
jgi:hypothetical protein